MGEDNQIISSGFNGFPIGVNDNVEERHQRPAKYSFTEHAERNSIYLAPSRLAMKGARMYMNFHPTPCHDCARGVIQAGIKKIIGPNIPFPGRGDMWTESLRVANIMLDEAGVIRIIVPWDLPKPA